MATIRKRPLPSQPGPLAGGLHQPSGQATVQAVPAPQGKRDYHFSTMACGGFVQHGNDIATKK
ncbi:hypothetical protein SAMN02744035_02813 [Thalassobacter stenotrophicus DSM 16310]|uniref:Uncharacterized protein n=1 Tax=Thalassobacter stenotrophicus DSM 16310 TaxID=1123361 RepID=A0ABY1IH53_9RHOB|nr:hypothetical protein SAMN02744035_02813 [Thalassobacter stenotrophicus DSM 16310]